MPARRLRLLPLLSLLLAAALLLAGCQSKEERAYVDRVNALAKESSAVLDRLDANAEPAANAKVLADFDEQVAAFRRVDPPDSVRAQHEALVEALEQLRDGMAKINAEPGDAESVQAGLKLVEGANDRLQEAVDDLDRKL